MYGPGSYNPWGYPPPPPPQGPQVIYVQTPSKGKGRGKNASRVVLDPLAAIQKAKDDIAKLEQMFKKEEKKDDKKGRTFTLLETVGINFILMLPTTLTLYLILKLAVR